MISENEREMQEAFEKQVQKLLANREKFVKNGRILKVGLESEVAVHGKLSTTELTRKRNKIIEENDDFTDIELGASQIEIRTPPIDILSTGGMAQLDHVYKERFASVVNSARKEDLGILRVGANPFLPTVGSPRTDNLKYKLVPDFYNQRRSPMLDTTIGLGCRVDIGDAAVISLFQSFQVNLEAKSMEDACDKMNRSFVIAPYILAFSGNARFLNCQDTQIQDVRMISWERSHDIRPFCDKRFAGPREGLRVGLPKGYFSNIEEYLIRAGSFPFILYNPKAALTISVGITWFDTRVKFVGDSAVVELRSLSTQPTINEEIVLTLFYIGRLYFAQSANEQLLPINMIRENRLSAMLYGLEGRMWFLNKNNSLVKLPAKIGLVLELERAVIGLSYLGLLSTLDRELLDTMLRIGSPSDRFSRSLNSKGVVSVEEMENALSETGMLVV